VTIAGAIVAAAVLGLRVGPWSVRSYRGLREEVAARSAVLARMRDAIGEAEALGDSSEAVRQAYLALAPRVLSGDTEAAALASLTGHLGAVADRSRTTLERADAVPDSTRMGGVRRISVRASFEGDTRGITAALRAIDANPIALSTGAVRVVAPDPGSADGVPEVLKGEIVISAWYAERGAR
jgi:hypothetical protein